MVCTSKFVRENNHRVGSVLTQITTPFHHRERAIAAMHKISIASIAVALLLGAHGAVAQSTASVEGAVTLPKVVVQAKPNARYAAQAGAFLPPEPPTAVVYLEGAPLPTTDTPVTNIVQVLQKGMQFGPGLIPVRKGTRVEFPNGDDFYHNVFSYSKTKRFDLGRFLKDEKPAAVTFDQPGVVKLYCEIHEHMRGTVLVLETPHFVKTDTNGVYRLTGLPAGQFKLKAWIDDKISYEQAVDLKPGSAARVNFPVAP
jgi:plastocyanin